VQELREGVDMARTSMLARWRRNRGRAERERRLGTREQVISTPHGLIAYADSGGDKPPVLFIHGNSACKEAFQYQFAALRDDFRLIAFDLPGHGVSGNGEPETDYNVPAYAEVAEKVLETCGVKNPVVFGWSLGGYVALELSARAVVKVRGLAIAGTTPLNLVPDDFGAGYDASSHLILAGKQYFSPTEARAYAGSATAPYSATSAFMHRNLGRTDGRARVYMFSKLGVTDWPRQMRMLRDGTVPFAILNGSDDPFLNHSYIRGLHYGSIWTGAPFDIAGGKHAPFFNKPDEFNAAFRRFMREACGL
jgi:pimeloyl-ACP methyl ester carboxylesterase